MSFVKFKMIKNRSSSINTGLAKVELKNLTQQLHANSRKMLFTVFRIIYILAVCKQMSSNKFKNKVNYNLST